MAIRYTPASAPKPTRPVGEKSAVQEKAPVILASDEKPLAIPTPKKAKPSVIKKTGKMRAWGVRLDEAILEMVKTHSKNQTRDAEEMIMKYAEAMGWLD